MKDLNLFNSTELKLFTSESVSEGHPDKVCDQISDAILDAVLSQDPNSRVACETFATTERIIVGGEIRTKAVVDYEKIVRDTLRGIGYVDKELGIGADTCEVTILLHEQSDDIAIGVDPKVRNKIKNPKSYAEAISNHISKKEELGAGDQGIMFGYACKETEGFMPLAIVVAHKLVREATRQRKSGVFKWARPDMKSQVTIDYTDPNHPKVHTVLMSIQHDPDFVEEDFKEYIENNVIHKVLKSFGLEDSQPLIYINPTGRFVTGGPHGDSGLTGRKIIVDTYGGYAAHGGGAFSGKDATKVDRSAAYAARWVAKNIVAADLCDVCQIQLSYGIGLAHPLSIQVNTFGTNKVDENVILKAIRNEFDLTPGGIIKTLELQKPIFSQVSAYGHMGRSDLDLSWERLNKVEDLKKYLELK